MRHVLLSALCLLPLLLTACTGLGVTNGAAAPAPLAAIRMYHSVMGSGHYAIQVTAAGDLTVELQPGPGDIQHAAGHLSPQQIAALAKAFQGWKNLQPIYPGDWTILIQITYDNYLVESHDLSQAPPNFVAAKALLDDLARQVMQAATRPAPAPPASAPAPAGPSSPRP